MHLGLSRCLLSRTLTTVAKQQSIDKQAVIQKTLAAYPIFNLNDDAGRHLGPQKGDEAILTLSGGVDSSVSAYLALERRGLIPHKTIFMRNWNSLEESESFEPGSGGAQGCQWQRDWDRVSAMAKWLGVKAELMDLSASYWNNVFSPSLDQWTRGLTPNPDVMCNREIKFGELLRRLDQTASTPQAAVDPRAFGRRQTKRWLVTGELDLQEMQATIAIAYFSPRSQYEGHYAGLQYYHPTSKPSAVHGRLLRALDRTKDQSYFLSAVSSDQLGRTHFPLSWMTKVEVRELARTLGMPTAESEESMGLCFVGERKGGASAKENPARRRQADTVGENGFAGFLGDYIKSSPGDIVALDGQVVGRHGGLHTLTIGQGAKLSGRKEKFFVAAKQPQLNQVVVVPGNDHAWLQCHSLQVSSFTFIDQDQGAVALQSDNILAQIRHRQGAVPCQATSVGGSLTVHFTPAILAVAEGQVCALYKGEECLGSGVITNVETEASRTAKEVIMTTQ